MSTLAKRVWFGGEEGENGGRYIFTVVGVGWSAVEGIVKSVGDDTAGR